MANASDDIVAKSKPQPRLVDGTTNPRNRKSGYGETYTQPLYVTKHALALEESYFAWTNPTIGTALAAAVQATFSDTVAAFVIANGGQLGDVDVYPDYLDLIITVAPASATSLQYALKLEPSSLRTPTAGNAAVTPVNTHGGSKRSANATIQTFTGAAFLTVPAATANARIVGRGTLRGVIPVVGDELSLAFGAVDPGGSGAGPSTGSRQGASAAAIIIPPQGSLTFHLWAPANAATGLSAEAEGGHWER